MYTRFEKYSVPFFVAAVAIVGSLLVQENLCGQSVTFADVTVQAGVDYIQHNYAKAPSGDRQVYITGGAAAADYDGDGWVDLFVTRLDDDDILFRNNGDSTFSDVTTQAFPDGFDPAASSNGAQWGDIDNDGDLDLYVTCIDANRYYLYINDGNGHFSEQAVLRGCDINGVDRHFGFSVAFGDYDLDGYLDMHTTEWREDFQVTPGTPFNARLFRNLGGGNAGSFADVTNSAGVAMENNPVSNPDRFEAQSFSTTFADMDRDGWPDLVIAGDHLTSRLYWNNGDGTFTDGTVAGNLGTDSFGMGSTIGDYDGDGDLDWFVTSIFDDLATTPPRDGNRLYRNDGNRIFTDVTDDAGVRNGEWGWGASFVDIDNDGDLDLVQTNGLDWPEPFFSPGAHADFIADPSKLWINDGAGHFTESALQIGFIDTRAGKGLLNFDFDNDGDQDVFVINNGEHPVLYRNDGGNTLNWLKIKTTGTVSNRDGIGAFITVTPDLSSPSDVVVREINSSSCFLGQSDKNAHFGLGNHSVADEIRIEWPSGIVQVYHDIDVNQTLDITEAILGDVNLDGEVNLLDVGPFVTLLTSGGYQVEADIDGNGLVNLIDVSPFIAILSGN